MRAEEKLKEGVINKCVINFYPDDLNGIAKTKKHEYILQETEKILKESFQSFINYYFKHKENLQKEEYIKETCSKYVSNVYKSLFSDLIYANEVLNKKIEKCLVKDHRTTIKLFSMPEEINDRSLDFYSTFLSKKGWNDYKKTVVLNESVIPVSNVKQKINLNDSFIIHGALVIDTNFVERIKNGESFSKSQFYTAKMYDKCQWYGIIHQYDIVRNDFETLLKIIKSSFISHEDFKVSAIVEGDGGSGKSTLLRSVAYHLHEQQQFEVLWLSDNEFESFLQSGVAEIIKQRDTNFLIFIEDWYRVTYGHSKSAAKFLKKSDSITNIRIVIGDRSSYGKEYLAHCSLAPFVLSAEENQFIITQIVTHHPQWEEVTQRLFKDKSNYNCTLFLLLFIIARLSEDRNQKESIDLSSPSRAFINIIENDLKSIPKKYEGLAKALYYWGCIYSEHRIFISYNAFLALADYFNEDSVISNTYSNWNSSSSALQKTKIYINQNLIVGDYSNENFIQFHHDILADMGLSKVSIKKWDPFDDVIKKQILDCLVKKGDATSASTFLGIMLQKETHLFGDREQKLAYITILIATTNRHYSYANKLINLDLQILEIQDFAQRLWQIKNYAIHFWTTYLHSKVEPSKKEYFIEKILSLENVCKINASIVCVALRQTKNATLKEEFINYVLQYWSDFDHQIICICLKSCKNKVVLQNFASYVLLHSEEFDSSVICICLTIATDHEVLQEFAKRVLMQWRDFDSQIICTCLNISNIDSAVQDFAKRVLMQWRDFDSQIICTCLNISNSDSAVQDLSEHVLQNYKDFDTQVICIGLNVLNNDQVKQDFSRQVLLNHKMFDTEIICSSLNSASKDSVLQDFTKEVLLNYKDFDTQIICTSLNLCENANLVKDFVRQVLLNHKEFDSQIICACLPFSKDLLILKTFSDKVFSARQEFDTRIISTTLKVTQSKDRALYFLEHWDYKPKGWSLIFQSLYCFENERNLPPEVHNIINRIIEEYQYSSNTILKLFYANLFRIALPDNDNWSCHAQKIIKNWNTLDRNLITNVLYSRWQSQNGVQEVCQNILRKWKSEVGMPIKVLYHQNHFGDHIVYALGHPSLRELGFNTAQEIVAETTIKIPGHLKKIVQKIVAEQQYPIWYTNI